MAKSSLRCLCRRFLLHSYSMNINSQAITEIWRDVFRIRSNLLAPFLLFLSSVVHVHVVQQICHHCAFRADFSTFKEILVCMLQQRQRENKKRKEYKKIYEYQIVRAGLKYFVIPTCKILLNHKTGASKCQNYYMFRLFLCFII